MRELDPADLVRALNAQVDPSVAPYDAHHPRGGSVSVGPLDTIACDGCWCGRPNGHDWLGREDGAPHPRYPD